MMIFPSRPTYYLWYGESVGGGGGGGGGGWDLSRLPKSVASYRKQSVSRGENVPPTINKCAIFCVLHIAYSPVDLNLLYKGGGLLSIKRMSCSKSGTTWLQIWLNKTENVVESWIRKRKSWEFFFFINKCINCLHLYLQRNFIMVSVWIVCFVFGSTQRNH